MASKYFDSETALNDCYRVAIENYLVGFGFTTLTHGHWLACLGDGGVCSISWDGIRRDTIKLILHKSFYDKRFDVVLQELESTGFYEDHFSRELILIVPNSIMPFFHPSENVGNENNAIEGILSSIKKCAFPILSIPTLGQLMAYKNDVNKLADSDDELPDYGSALMKLAVDYGATEIEIVPPPK